MHRRGLARGLRGAIAGALTTTLALAFHVIGGGEAPGVVAVVGSFLGAIWLSILIGRRRRSLPFLTAAVAVSQLLLHTVFAAATATGSVSGGGHADHGAMRFVLGHDGQAMWWAHALAGVLTVAMLHRGERLLVGIAALAALVARAVLRLASLATPATPARRLPAAPRPVPLPLAERRTAVTVLRGPPAAFVI